MGRISISIVAIALITILPLAPALDSEEAAFLTIINNYRATNGLGSLSLSPTLTVASELHSQDMANQDYFSHYSLDNRSPVDRMVAAGYDYPTVYGENIAAGYLTADTVFEGWRNSPGHNQAMLHPDFVVIGIGRYFNSSSYYGWYWTTDFGGYDHSGSPPPPPPPPPPPAVQVSSPTHPSQTTWYSDDDPGFAWTPVSGADGYSYHIDHSSTTNADTIIDSTNTSREYTDLSDGIWYFHIRVKTSGGWGQTSHLKVMIDTTPPSAPTVSSTTHPDQGSEYSNDDPQFQWSTSSDPSGTSGYSLVIDQEPGTIPDTDVDTQNEEWSVQGLGEGTWYFHLRSVDGAGNWGPATHFTINIRFVPNADFQASPIYGFEPLVVYFTDLSSSSSGITSRLWDFGDDTTSTEENPVHIYPEEGSYSVNLTVWEGDADSDSESKTNYIVVVEPVPDDDILDLFPGGIDTIGSEILGLYADGDGYVDPSHPSDSFGHEEDLVVDDSGSIAYLKYDLSSIPPGADIISSSIGIFIQDGEQLLDPQVEVYTSDGPDWNESDLAWDTRPLLNQNVIDSRAITNINQSYGIFDVTQTTSQYLSTGHLTLALKVGSGSGTIRFSSREGSTRPVLVVRYAVGDIHNLSLSSYENSGTAPNLGQIILDDRILSLPTSVLIVGGSYPVGYIPGYDFEAWETQGPVQIGSPGDINTTINIGGSGSVAASGLLTSITLAYDDGTSEYSAGGSSGELFGVLFSPDYSGNLSQIDIYIGNVYGFVNNTALIHVMDPLGRDILPPIPFTPIQEGWTGVVLTEEIPITGNFSVCLEYLNDNYPRVGVDGDGEGSSFTITDFGQWEYHSNYMIRGRIRLDQPPTEIVRLHHVLSPYTPTAGFPLILSGQLDPPLEGIEVDVTLVSPNGTELDFLRITNSSGGCSLVYTPLKAGNWLISVEWSSPPGYVGSSLAIETPVQVGEVELSCNVEPIVCNYGNSVRIFGSIEPVGLPLGLEFKHNGGGWELLHLVQPADNLTYSHIWIPPVAGDFEFRVRWNGSDDFPGSISFPRYLYVFQANTIVEIDISESVTTYGHNISIAGSVSPGISVPVNIDRWNSSSWVPIATTQSRADGNFSLSWQVNFVGSALLRASWDGDTNYFGGSSDAVIVFSERAPSSISLDAQPMEAIPNQSVSLTGTITPPLEEVTVTITLTHPSGDQTQMLSMTNVTGDYTTKLNPDQIGEWRILASWEGNQVYMGSDTGELALSVGVDEASVIIIFISLGAWIARSILPRREDLD